jgi:hypothetical protein
MDTRSLDHHGVPHSVLTGTDKRFAPVYALFRARMTQEWFRHLNHSYWLRATGTDDAGIHWRKLSKWTVKEKRELEENGQHINYISPGQLPPNIGIGIETAQNQYELDYQRIISSDKSNSSTATKRARAKREALALQGERSFAKIINVRTGRLVSATYPGEVVNNRYYPTKDQTVTFKGPKILISLRKVEYARDVDNQREIIPRNTDVWYIESWNTVMPEVANLYREMKENNPALAKPKKRKKRGQGLEDAPL